MFENISTYLEIDLFMKITIECPEFNGLSCKSLEDKIVERNSDDGSLFYENSEGRLRVLKMILMGYSCHILN